MKKLAILLLFAILLTSCKTVNMFGDNRRRANRNENYETVTNVYKTTFIDMPAGYNIRSFYKDNRIYRLDNEYIEDPENRTSTQGYSLHIIDTETNNSEVIFLGVFYYMERKLDIAEGEIIEEGKEYKNIIIYHGIQLYMVNILSDGNFIAFGYNHDKGLYTLVTFAPDGSVVDIVAIVK